MEAGASALTDLAADLTAFVDQLDADLSSRRPIGQRSADQLQELRKRAEGLFPPAR